MSLAEHRFFQLFPAALAGRLVAATETASFPSGHRLFDEGEASDSVYMLLAGRVELAKRASSGAYLPVFCAEADDYFGELGSLDDSPRSARATALADITVGKLPRTALLDVVAQAPWSSLQGLIRHVTDGLRASNVRYVAALTQREKLSLVGEMAGGILHDFRGPSACISLAAELIARQHPDETTNRWCRQILQHLDHMNGMVSEVLEFSRGETRLSRRRVSLGYLFAEAAGYNEARLTKAGVSLVVEPTAAEAYLDSARFHRVLQNLIGNAIDALRGRPDAAITLAAADSGRGSAITIRDNGPGIPAEIRGTLFHPFVTHGKAGGTGLGLAIVQGIVAAHEGSIAVDCPPGGGTVFTIGLPPGPAGP